MGVYREGNLGPGDIRVRATISRWQVFRSLSRVRTRRRTGAALILFAPVCLAKEVALCLKMLETSWVFSGRRRNI